MKRTIPIFLAAVLFLSGCSLSNRQPVSREAAKETPTPRDIYIMAGKISANEEVNVNSKIPAKVTKVAVDVGSKVNKGDTVIFLDTKDIEAQVRQAEASVSTAQANLTKAVTGARPEQIAQAGAALESASKNYDIAKNNYERTKQLYQTGAASQQQLEATEGQYAAADAQKRSAQEQLDMLNRGETKETLDVLQSQVKQAQAALELSQTQLANGIIQSPITGVVSAKSINEGELAAAGMTLLTIVNADSMYVNAYIPAGLVSQIKPDQDVIVKVSEVADKKYQGKVSVINPVIDSKGKNVLVKVVLQNPDPVLKPGMFAEIGIKK